MQGRPGALAPFSATRACAVTSGTEQAPTKSYLLREADLTRASCGELAEKQEKEARKEERQASAVLEEPKAIALECMRDLKKFVHEVTKDPKQATPESVAALPEVARSMALLYDILTH